MGKERISMQMSLSSINNIHDFQFWESAFISISNLEVSKAAEWISAEIGLLSFDHTSLHMVILDMSRCVSDDYKKEMYELLG